MDLEPEGKVFVVIALTGSFTEGKNEFWVVSRIYVIRNPGLYSVGISIMEIVKKSLL